MAPGHWLALALWLPLMLTAAAAEERRPCSPNKCGNHTISHPFWLPDRATGRSCGSPDFEVTCSNKSTPVILNSAAISLGFAILRVSYEDRSLHVVDLGKRYLLQHAPNSCLVPIWNTSAKLSAPFTISPGSLGLVLYSCPEAAGAAALALGGGELVRTGMRCGNESQVLVRAGGRYNGTGGYGRYEGCDSAVMPVLGANGEANASDYVRLIDDGFFLTWELPPPRKSTSQIYHVLCLDFPYLTKAVVSIQSWHSLAEDKAVDLKSCPVQSSSAINVGRGRPGRPARHLHLAARQGRIVRPLDHSVGSMCFYFLISI